MVEVDPIIGAQHTFLFFLWRQIAEIRELQKRGYYYEALVQAIDLVDYLPRDFKNKLKFHEKAQKIAKKISEIDQNTGGVDAYTQMVDSLSSLDEYAKTILKQFMADLCSNLDAKGYMETPPITPRFKGQKMGVPEW